MPALAQKRLASEFEAFYAKHFAFVWRTLRRFGIREAALDDATQDVFVVVHRRFGAWEDRSERAWLYVVARRVASTHRRGADRHERKLAALKLAGEEREDVERRVGNRARLERAARALDSLEPGRRQVYILMELEGFSAPEAAAALGCKLNTVYSRLRRARAEMSAALHLDREDDA